MSSEQTFGTTPELEAAIALNTELVDNYKWFHQHPELSYHEVDTTARIRKILGDHNVEILDTNLTTGVIAVIKGATAAPVIALRGDIDGLPIQENTGLPYASTNPGVMHGCGHDFNLTVALGAAIVLNEQREQLEGTIKIIFQPAEEGRATASRQTGAVEMIDTQVLDDVQAFFGTHDCSGPVGSVFLRAGAISGAVDKFSVTITGEGTHAASPNQGVDPVVATTAIVQSLQTIVGRNIDPVHPRVLTVTHIEAGSTWNVIPELAFFEGTVRTSEQQDRIVAKNAAMQLIEHIAAAYGTKADIRWFFGSPAVNNDPTWTHVAEQTVRDLGLTVAEQKPGMGGEDFSYYLQKAPGLFTHIGAGDAGAIHSPTFAPDPSGIHFGVAYLTSLAKTALIQLSEAPARQDSSSSSKIL